MVHLSRPAARALMLAAQGLLQPTDQTATKAGLRAAIQRMGILQIDTIHVVARSPYLVLWSRLGDYDPRWLDELLAEGAVFEYWSHEASFLPTENYPLYRRTQLEGTARSWSFVQRWVEEHRSEIERMLAYIREHGAVMSSDFERTDGQKGTWWNWKAEKIALEMLYTIGELMIARRKNFQRVYDLRERVMPAWDDASAPSLDEVYRQFALTTVRALGVVLPRWQNDYFRVKKQNSTRLLAQLAAEGLLIPVSVEGFSEPGYAHYDNRELVEHAAQEALTPTHTTLLSPFDPIVWDRRRALELFDFDYRIECYMPAPKRRYGYFTLPILWRGQLIGRLDPKAHRKEGIFEIKALHLEPGVAITEQLVEDLSATLRACASWHGTPEVVVRWSDPPELAKRLNTPKQGQKRARNVAKDVQMDVGHVLTQIESVADPRALTIWSRMNISPDRYLGANLTKLKELAKTIKKNHALAIGLWDTHIHDAKLLATMIEEPKHVTSEQVERQAGQIYSVDLADKYVSNVLAKTPYVQSYVDMWLQSENEMHKRMAYALLMAQAKGQPALDDSYFLAHLATIEAALQDEKNWVKEMMNYAVIAIGSRNPVLHQAALAAAQRIGPVEVDYGDTSCKTTDARAALNAPRLVAALQ